MKGVRKDLTVPFITHSIVRDCSTYCWILRTLFKKSCKLFSVCCLCSAQKRVVLELSEYYVCLCTNIYTHSYTCANVPTYTCTHIYTCILVYINMHSYTHICIHICSYTCDMHTYTHMAHTYTHKHIYSCMYALGVYYMCV